MDLWIRSQNKEKLLKVDGIKYSYSKFYDEYTYEILTIKGTLLGEYKSKARALEVLDEIQEILVPAVVFKNVPDSDNAKEISELYKLSGKCISTTNNADIHYVNPTYVYQMPEE